MASLSEGFNSWETALRQGPLDGFMIDLLIIHGHSRKIKRAWQERNISCNQSAAPFSFFLSPSHRLIHQRTFAMPHFRDPGFKARLYFTKRKILKSLARSLRAKGKKNHPLIVTSMLALGKKKKKKCICKGNHLKRIKEKLLTFVLCHLNFFVSFSVQVTCTKSGLLENYRGHIKVLI